jgi:hypothetical protein
MSLFIFLLKECLLKPKAFFTHQHDNPGIIKMPWGVLPVITFILFAAVHWISISYSLDKIILNFDVFFSIHIDHIFFATFSLLFIWLKLWIPLRLLSPVGSDSWRITAWCNCPYIFIFFVMLIIYAIYVPFIADTPNYPTGSSPTVISTQFGTTFFKVSRILADLWCLFTLYIAITIFAPSKRNLVMIGAIGISVLPTIAFFIGINR